MTGCKDRLSKALGQSFTAANLGPTGAPGVQRQLCEARFFATVYDLTGC